MNRLNEANTVTVKYTTKGDNVVVKVEEVIEPEDIELVTKWKYEGPQDSKNRDFCAKMLKAGKLYTRAEIDNLNNDMTDFTDDVWKYKGGWYHNPSLGVNLPQCRHWWNQAIYKKKTK